MEKYTKKLPIELVNKIINYTGVVSFRNGKYINRIKNSDERYKILARIPKPMKVGNKKVLLKLMSYIDTNEYYGYLIEYTFDTHIKANIRCVNRYYDGFDRVYNLLSNNTLIRDANGKWQKYVEYLM